MNSYTNNGVEVMIQLASLLRHTSYDIASVSKENLRNYLLSYRTMAHLYDIPKSVSGRSHGQNAARLMISSFALLSKCFDESKPDEELAKALVRLWTPAHSAVDQLLGTVNSAIMFNNTLGQISSILDIIEEGFPAEASPVGFWAKPYASMAIFRGDEWSVTVKGNSKYVWDYETSSSKENDFGRYDSHGQMEIINNKHPFPNAKSSGHDINSGWNWGKVPGTTTVAYNNNELINSSLHRNFTNNPTVGALSHGGKNGIWAMEYGDVAYGSGLRFKKSIFFFGDDQMVCLGSDIASFDRSRTVSTITQHVITSSLAAFMVDEVFVRNGDKILPSNSDRIIYNTLGAGYYIKDASNLHIARMQQASKTVKGQADSSGDVFTAWFDNSNKQSYEYVVLMNGNPDTLNKFREKPNYRVIEQSSNAHIVEFLPDSITAYVIFNAASNFKNSYIRNSSGPIFAMMEKSSPEDFTLSICDPDFNRSALNDKTYEGMRGPYKPTKVNITLAGRWELDGDYHFAEMISSNQVSSVLSFTCFDAESYEVKLKSFSATFEEIVEESSFYISRKPNSDLFFLSSYVSGTIIDINGSQIKSLKHQDSFDLSTYPRGVYILKWEDGRDSGTKKFIK